MPQTHDSMILVGFQNHTSLIPAFSHGHEIRSSLALSVVVIVVALVGAVKQLVSIAVLADAVVTHVPLYYEHLVSAIVYD